MDEVEAIKQDLLELKTEMKSSLSGIRTDLKELAKALRELIRLDGDVGRVADLANRIGKQVDEIARLMREDKIEVDRRLRQLETSHAGDRKSIGLFDEIMKYSITLIIGSVAGAVLMRIFA